MHKKTIAIVLVATALFIMMPFIWQRINFQCGRPLYADWSAWWSFGTFLLAVIAACLTWQEYHAAKRPRLMVKLAKSYQQLVAGEITESVHFYAENIGGGVSGAQCGYPSLSWNPLALGITSRWRRAGVYGHS